MPVLFLFSVSRGQTFRRYSGAPLEATVRPMAFTLSRG